MGIRGLTTFINSNCKYYFEEYHLRDCYLVIDGFNIASHLYIWHCKRNDCFGGDYDKYGKVVQEFFKILENCKVIPIIIFDGGYENKKYKTIYDRFKSKVRSAKHLNSVTQNKMTMFPLFLRPLFIDIVLSLNLKAIQCDLEADYEMACVAKSLNCPVLSYDSDFYIFDVLYIPFSTFQMKAQKTKNSSETFINCQLYKIEKFLSLMGGLNKENLPLLATLLGNDYIKMSVFENFYNELKLPKSKPGKTTQTKILGVIKWLLNENYNSAVLKILSKIKYDNRAFIADQIKISTDTYLNYNSEVLDCLDLNVGPVKHKTFDLPLHTEKYVQNNAILEDDELEENTNEIEINSSEESDDTSSEPECDSQELSIKNHIPDWFQQNFRRCQYPQSFMDILCHNVYISTPQIEDYSNICSHDISLPILAAIQKIMLSESGEDLTCILRKNRSSGINRLKIPPCTKSLPKLLDIISFKPEDAKAIIFRILDIDYGEFLDELLEALPNTWQLYFIALIYWVKKTSPTATYSHIYSIILCSFVLNLLDSKIGFYRSTYKFTSKFAKIISKIVNIPKNMSNNNLQFKEYLKSISYNECLLCYKEFIDYFEMSEKMKSNPKLFDVRILDCFAQFQSCLLHIRHLNVLFNKPFCNFVISEFYDGTFLYNMYSNLKKRTNIETYLHQTLLKCAPNIFSCLKKIMQMLVNVMPAYDMTEQRKRKARKKKSIITDSEDVHIADQISDEENIIDVNNRFSVLSMIK